MAKISQEKIEEILRLYQEIGVYSKVAKQVGCSPATVSRYVKLYDGSQCGQIKENVSEKNIIHFDDEVVPITQLLNNEYIEKFNLTLRDGLSAEELNELKVLWEEM